MGHLTYSGAKPRGDIEREDGLIASCHGVVSPCTVQYARFKSAMVQVISFETRRSVWGDSDSAVYWRSRVLSALKLDEKNIWLEWVYMVSK